MNEEELTTLANAGYVDLAGRSLTQPHVPPAPVVAFLRRLSDEAFKNRPHGMVKEHAFLTNLADAVEKLPAANAEGWWVKPEWQPGMGRGGLNLYVGGVFAGNVYPSTDEGYWLVFRNGYTETFPTRELAQAALLAAVRPKDAGA